MDGVGAASLDQSERVPGPLATSRPAPNARTCLPPEAGSQPGPIRRGAPGHNLGHQTNEDESRLCRGPGDNPGRARYRVLHYTGKPSRGQHCTAPVGSYGWHRRRPPVTLDGEVVAHHRQVSSSSTSTREMRSWISGSCFRSIGCNPLPVRRLTSSSLAVSSTILPASASCQWTPSKADRTKRPATRHSNRVRPYASGPAS